MLDSVRGEGDAENWYEAAVRCQVKILWTQLYWVGIEGDMLQFVWADCHRKCASDIMDGQTSSPYRAVNNFHLCYKNQSVNVV